MPPTMANSNEGQYHKDKYFDTSRKILPQEITMCSMEALVSFFKEVMTNVNFFLVNPWSNVKVKSLRTYKKISSSCDIHVKYQSSSTHCSKVISKVKVSEMRTELQNDRQDKNNMPPNLRSRGHKNGEWGSQ